MRCTVHSWRLRPMPFGVLLSRRWRGGRRLFAQTFPLARPNWESRLGCWPLGQRAVVEHVVPPSGQIHLPRLRCIVLIYNRRGECCVLAVPHVWRVTVQLTV